MRAVNEVSSSFKINWYKVQFAVILKLGEQMNKADDLKW